MKCKQNFMRKPILEEMVKSEYFCTRFEESGQWWESVIEQKGVKDKS